MVIHADELTPETREKLKLGKGDKGKVPQKVVALGKMLQATEGLTTRDALWALRTAHSHVRGYRKIKSKAVVLKTRVIS